MRALGFGRALSRHLIGAGEGMDMRIGYVASKSSNRTYALEPENIISVCFTGPDPEGDAESYAKDHTKATDQNTYIHRVSIESVRGFKVTKDVVSFAVPL